MIKKVSILLFLFLYLEVVFSVPPVEDNTELETIAKQLARVMHHKMLYKKKKRGANKNLKKSMHYLGKAYLLRLNPKEVAKRAADINKTPKRYKKWLLWSLSNNFSICKKYGLFTVENLKRLKKGHAPIVTKGIYQGEKMQVDHIIPVSIAPRLGNLIANLELIPASKNLSKGEHPKRA